MSLKQRKQIGISNRAGKNRTEPGILAEWGSGPFGLARRQWRLARPLKNSGVLSGWKRRRRGSMGRCRSSRILLRRGPQQRLDKFPGYVVADDMDLGNVVRPNLAEKG